jgi:hypothetical protein
MLFDLRSPGRRRVIKTVYFFLALLIGVGLVGFGVGTGGSFGGLFSAAANGGGSSGTGNTKILNELKSAEKKAKASPKNAALWAKAGVAAYAVAVLPDNYDSSLGYTTGGHAALDKMKVAWQHYLALAPSAPDISFAQEVSGAFAIPPTGIQDWATAESAQEIVAENDQTAQQYEYLAYYAYQAKDLTTGDQAGAKAITLAPKKQAKTLKTTLLEMRASVTGSTGASGATGST